jgi:beta-glucosidase
VNATSRGLVNESEIDVSVARLLAIHMRLGLFDPPDMVPFTQIGMDVVNSAAHRSLAADAARESLVLLRNPKGLLPLDRSSGALVRPGGVLVTGPNSQLFATGNYNTQTDRNVTALDGVRAYMPAAAFEPGCASVAGNDTSLVAAAVAAAAAAEVVVAVMGIDGSQEYEDSTRESLALPGVQDQLITAIAATGTPIVLVLVGGSAVAPAPATLAAAAAVLWVGYGGEEAGTALADALFGAYNPGGRLPITFYQSADHLPPYLNMSMTGAPYGRTLRYFTGPAPLFRFGEGRSYSSFKLSSVNVSVSSPTGVEYHGSGHAGLPALHSRATSFSICDSLHVSVDVSNAGPLAGGTVIQAYVRIRSAPLLTPLLSLSAFERRSLGVGAAASVQFVLSPRAFAIVDGDAREWWLFPATVDVFVGEESPATQADWASSGAATLELTGSARPLSHCSR